MTSSSEVMVNGRNRRPRAVMLLVALLLLGGSAAAQRPQISPQALEDSFVQVAQSVKPAVVNIATTQRPRPPEHRQVHPFFRGPFQEFFHEDFFERFFGERIPRERHSLGSGVIVDTRGHILTNNHVVERADEIQVRLSDGRNFQARVAGKDPKTDVAVIKIDVEGDLPVARLGDSDKIRTGEWAMAIGNPFGLDQTVTVGVISAVGRGGMGITTYEDFIQTDASINPGNSGGPLVNLRGEVIGLNTAILATGQGIGFAIPINMAREIKDRLIAYGRVVRGWLGVGIQPLTEDLAAQFGVTPEAGVLVGNVVPGGPADRSGLRPGDIIQEFNGTKITSARQLQLEVARSPVGSQARLTVLRQGQPLTPTVTLGEQPTERVAGVTPSRSDVAGRFGFTVQELTPELQEQLKLGRMDGIVVSGMDQAGLAAQAGIRPGDAILEANRQPVPSVRDFEGIVAKVPLGAPLLLLVWREGASHYVVLRSSP